ncbi:hypothetical protein ACOMHN_028774 [Nucella lapillus]
MAAAEAHPLATLSPTTTTLAAPMPLGGGDRPAPPDYLLHTQLVCDRVLVPLVVTFGILGNVLSLVVLSRKEMASATSSFLTGLAVSDLSLLLLQLPVFFGLSPHVAASDGFRLFVRYYTVILYVMTNVFLTCTSWLTVAVTVERFLSLRFMMHPRIVCTIKRAKRAIIAIFFASFLFHFSKFFEYVPNTDLSSPRLLLPTELSLNKTYDSAMHIINIALAALLPIVALVIFNSFLIYFLATHRRRMLKHKTGKAGLGLGNGSSGGATSVDMLHVSCVVVAVVLVFVACHSLGVFVALNIATHGRHKVFSDHLFLAFKSVNGLLVMLNSSVNFLLYCSISRKFRKMFAAIFCRQCWLAKSSSSWSLPVPLSENSMATAVSIRAPPQPTTAFTSRPAAVAGPDSGPKSFVRSSPPASSFASRSAADQALV